MSASESKKMLAKLQETNKKLKSTSARLSELNKQFQKEKGSLKR